MNNEVILECENLGKTFIDGKNQLTILNNINLQIRRGQQIAILGRSGSGKSTLLQLLGGLDQPTTGAVYLKGKNWTQQSETQRSKWRNQNLGFIYQMHHLLPEFSAQENVALPLLIAGVSANKAMQAAAELITSVGLADRLEHRPAKLSGGERQRVAIARALVNNPACVLADEPTGNLDAENAELTFDLMQKLNRERGTCFVIVTHDQELAARMDARYSLQDRHPGLSVIPAL